MAEKVKKWKIAFIVMLAVSLVSTIIAISSLIKPLHINIHVPYETEKITDTETSVTEQENDSFLSVIWQLITEYVAPLADFFVVIISISIFGLTYVSKKISVIGISTTAGVYDGYKVALTLKNETLSDFSIESVHMIIDDKYSFLINKSDMPIILGPLKALNFESRYYSCNPIKDVYSIGESHKVKAEIILSDGKTIIAKHRKTKRRKRKFYENVHPVLVRDGDSVVTESMLYKVEICDDKKIIDKIIILKNGYMNKSINGYRSLPQECLQDKDTVKSTIEELLSKKEYTVSVYDYSVEHLWRF